MTSKEARGAFYQRGDRVVTVFPVSDAVKLLLLYSTLGIRCVQLGLQASSWTAWALRADKLSLSTFASVRLGQE